MDLLRVLVRILTLILEYLLQLIYFFVKRSNLILLQSGMFLCANLNHIDRIIEFLIFSLYCLF